LSQVVSTSPSSVGRALSSHSHWIGIRSEATRSFGTVVTVSRSVRVFEPLFPSTRMVIGVVASLPASSVKVAGICVGAFWPTE
jgi:hypothetical protein